MNQEFNGLHDIKPPLLFDFSNKPKVLYIADVPNWSFDIKGKQYIKYLPQLEIDIGYASKELSPEGQHWEEMILKKRYDVIWHLHAWNFGSDNESMHEFVRDQNRQGTQVILTQNEVTPLEAILGDIKRFSGYNCISVNNPWAYNNFLRAGFTNIFTTFDGVDLNVFGHDKPIHKRKFKVFFASSTMRLEHKGYYILQEVKKLLADYPDIEFVEIIADSMNNKRSQEEMNAIYNDCQVFVCLSVSEGGPCTLQEAAACGLVPIMTRVGYCDYFKNLFIIERDAKNCAEKILYLKNNPEVLYNMSKGISKEILPWHDKNMSQHWGYFAQRAILARKRAILP